LVFSEPQSAWILGVAFSPDSRLLATTSDDNTLYVRSIGDATSRLLHTFSLSPTGVSFSSDGARVLVGSIDDTLSLWDIASGEAQMVLPVPDTPNDKDIYDVAFLGSDERAVSVSGNGMIRFWDLAAKQVIQDFFVDAGISFYHVAASEDGRYVVAVGDSSIVVLVDVQSHQVGKLEAHRGSVLGVAFLPDGKGFVTSGSEGTLRFWDLESCHVGLGAIESCPSVELPVWMGAYSVAVAANTIAYSTAVGTQFASWKESIRIFSEQEVGRQLEEALLPPARTLE
jgi:WD40 repeat protein